jgi:hypothetical protein
LLYGELCFINEIGENHMDVMSKENEVGRLSKRNEEYLQVIKMNPDAGDRVAEVYDLCSAGIILQKKEGIEELRQMMLKQRDDFLQKIEEIRNNSEYKRGEIKSGEVVFILGSAAKYPREKYHKIYL